MRTGLRRYVCAVARYTLVPFVRRIAQRDRLTILMYHRPSPATMAAHVRFLERAYNLVTLRAAVEALREPGRHALPPRPLVVTLDDGHASNAELAEVFATMSAAPTILLCSGLVGRDEAFWFDLVDDPEPLKRLADDARLERVREAAAGAAPRGRSVLSDGEVAQLRGCVDFQAHTVSHPILTQCTTEKARTEIIQAKADLEDRYDLDVYAIAWPNGDHSPREVAIAREAGYACALTVQDGLNELGGDPFALRRIPVNDDEDDVNVLAVKACGCWGFVKGLLRPRADRVTTR